MVKDIEFLLGPPRYHDHSLDMDDPLASKNETDGACGIHDTKSCDSPTRERLADILEFIPMKRDADFMLKPPDGWMESAEHEDSGSQVLHFEEPEGLEYQVGGWRVLEKDKGDSSVLFENIQMHLLLEEARADMERQLSLASSYETPRRPLCIGDSQISTMEDKNISNASVIL